MVFNFLPTNINYQLSLKHVMV